MAYMVTADYLRRRIAPLNRRRRLLYTDHRDATRTHPHDLEDNCVEHLAAASLRDGISTVIDLPDGVLPLCTDPNRVVIESALLVLDADGIATPHGGPPIHVPIDAATDAELDAILTVVGTKTVDLVTLTL
uniref:Uncharacterized protein n=1 Tax=Oryza punctata TaxID=4537 RepID=A0A0E0MDM1_ORYPU